MVANKVVVLNNGKKMPSLGLGTWMAPDHEIEAALNAALEAGYRHIDAAPVYLNEKAIGRVLKKWIDDGKVKRDDLFITTKLPPPGNRASSVKEYLRKSLEDLQLSYVDMYLIHTPFTVPQTDGDFLKQENGDLVLETDTDHVATWKKLEEMVSLGLTKSIGISNFNIKQIQRVLDNSTIKPSNLQIELHIYLQQNELVNFAKDNGIVCTAYSPLGSKGLKELQADRNLPDLLDNKNVIDIAKSHGKTPAQILLRWIVERGVVAIPKSTNPERLRLNLDVFNFELSADDLKTLANLDNGIRVCDFSFFPGITNHPEFPW